MDRLFGMIVLAFLAYQFYKGFVGKYNSGGDQNGQGGGNMNRSNMSRGGGFGGSSPFGGSQNRGGGSSPFGGSQNRGGGSPFGGSQNRGGGSPFGSGGGNSPFGGRSGGEFNNNNRLR